MQLLILCDVYYTYNQPTMKNIQSKYLAAAVVFSSVLAFVYLNSCGLPAELGDANTALFSTEISETDYSSMADVKLVQYLLNKLILVFTSI